MTAKRRPAHGADALPWRISSHRFPAPLLCETAHALLGNSQNRGSKRGGLDAHQPVGHGDEAPRQLPARTVWNSPFQHVAVLVPAVRLVGVPRKAAHPPSYGPPQPDDRHVRAVLVDAGPRVALSPYLTPRRYRRRRR